jgi:hypothetical protein
MSKWRELEWKTPRKGDVIRDSDGNIALVTRTEGPLNSKNLWASDEKGTEIYTNEPCSQFQVVENEKASKFHISRYKIMGYEVGALCSYRNTEIPLEILQVDWSFLRNKMTFCLRDLREFSGEIMKTENLKNLKVFSHNYPPVEQVFSTENTGTKYRIEVSLVERSNPGWENCGSPWEFFEKEDALKEVERWKAQLKIRRVASVLSSHWKTEFPCWIVEAKNFKDKILTRVRKTETATGSPGYFQTSMHAALAMKMISSETWHAAYNFSQDGPLV